MREIVAISRVCNFCLGLPFYRILPPVMKWGGIAITSSVCLNFVRAPSSAPLCLLRPHLVWRCIFMSWRVVPADCTAVLVTVRMQSLKEWSPSGIPRMQKFPPPSFPAENSELCETLGVNAHLSFACSGQVIRGFVVVQNKIHFGDVL